MKTIRDILELNIIFFRTITRRSRRQRTPDMFEYDSDKMMLLFAIAISVLVHIEGMLSFITSFLPT